MRSRHVSGVLQKGDWGYAPNKQKTVRLPEGGMAVF